MTSSPDDFSFIYHFKYTKKTIENIGINPTISDFPNILLIYDDYLNDIKINGSKTKLLYMHTYIIDPDSTPNIFFNKTLIIINYIINKYLSLDVEILTQNEAINNYLVYCIYKTVFILYEYYYYIRELTNYYKKNASGTIDNFLLELNKTINSNIKSNKKRLYYNIIKNFYKDVLKIRNIFNDEIYFDPKIIENNYDIVKSLFTDDKNDDIYLKSILILIIKIKDDISINFSKIDTYITIPQYSGVCWYISILTAICYSDGSKDLIIKKFKNHKSLSNTELIFKKYITYIIKNITKNHKKYSNPITNDCEYLKMFKDNELTYLKNRYKEFFLEKEKILEKLTYYNLDEIIGCDDDYYYYYRYLVKKDIVDNKISDINHKIQVITININQLNIFLEEPNLSSADKKEGLETINLYKKEITKLNERIIELNNSLSSLNINDSIGNIFFGYLILNSLYKILGISTLYLFNDIRNSTNYYKQTAKIASIPDIIFINFFDSKHYLYDIYTEKYFDTIPNIGKLSKIDITEYDNIIIYNGYRYKLDFLLHRTDPEATCKKCAHCISGIHYKGEQYYYSSTNLQKKIKCDDDDNIMIPCSLIKQEWKPKLDEKQKTHFCLKECFYHEFKFDNNFKIEKDFSQDNMCFNLKFNYIYAYIKID